MNNNFNLFRLFFAILVIFSHSFELVDGNRHREILALIFGHITFAHLAVDSFFILSGYLIVKSRIQSLNFFDFLKKRILRIYPGFAVASIFSAFIIAPFVCTSNQYFNEFKILLYLKSTILLHTPAIPPVFSGLAYPLINGSMWTIEFEFYCYLIAGLIGFLNLKTIKIIWIILFFIFSIVHYEFNSINFYNLPKISSPAFWHFILLFFSGGIFFLFENKIPRNRGLLSFCTITFLLSLFTENFIEIGYAFLGSYVLFYLSFCKKKYLTKLKPKFDISYGIYLYAWPIQNLLIWIWPSIHPLTLFFICIPICFSLGYFSWILIEKPFLKFRKS